MQRFLVPLVINNTQEGGADQSGIDQGSDNDKARC